MNLIQRTIVSCLTALVVITAIYYIMPSYVLKPQGIVLPLTAPPSPYQGKVTLYTTGIMPNDFTTIGRITVQYHSEFMTFREQTLLNNEAKRLAAQAGGNGVIFSIQHTASSVPAPQAFLLLQGTVIYTREDA